MSRITANRTATLGAPERGGSGGPVVRQQVQPGQPMRGRKLTWRQARAMAMREAAKAGAVEEATELEGAVGVIVGVPEGFSVEDIDEDEDGGDEEPEEEEDD